MEGLRYAVLVDHALQRYWSVMYPIPLPGEPWGVLACIKDTIWARSIPTVSKTGLDHALHGYVTQEFIREMGTAPFMQGRKIPDALAYCRDHQSRTCAMRTIDCRPGRPVPACYRVPVDDDVSQYLTVIVRAWADGRHVFVVDEEI